MSDDRLRALERAWERSGSREDEVALLAERLRSGNLLPIQMHVAGYAGHVPARQALGGRGSWCVSTHMGSGTEDCPRRLHHHHDDRCHLDHPPFGLWCQGWISNFQIGVAVRLAYFASMHTYNARLTLDDQGERHAAAAALLAVKQWLEEPTHGKAAIVASASAAADHVRWARLPGRLLAIFYHNIRPGVSSTQSVSRTCGDVLHSAFSEAWQYTTKATKQHISMREWVDEVVVTQTIKWALGEKHARTDALLRNHELRRA